MKLFLVFSISLLLFSCKKNYTANEPVNDPVSATAPVIVKGVFSGSGGHATSGTAEIAVENGVKKLVLKGFSTTAGPDLRVYLSTNQQASDFISLGTLKSTNGQQVYDISGMPDFTKYKFALVWCQQFSVLFGWAELK